jgi:RHS repeat-associated protein
MLAESSLTTGNSADVGAGSNYPFLTSKERDNETGLDYFLARYYSPTQGRFASVDPMAGSIGDPQSLNGYSYVWNNPLKLTDNDQPRCGKSVAPS